MLRYSLIFVLMSSIFNHFSPVHGQEYHSGDRMPAVAGRFYPKTEEDLRVELGKLFRKAKPRTVKNVRAILCPHAGYIFSGEVAASGYNQVDPDVPYEHVFLIASSHQVSFDGASVYTAGDYITPLGRVRVDIETGNSLVREHPVFSFRPEADKTEHSTEVQVPFLQYHLKQPVNLVPIVIGTQSAKVCSKIADALRPYFNKKNLFVISTDFSHYPSYEDAVKTDQATCDAIVSGSADALQKLNAKLGNAGIPGLVTNLCGWTSVLVLMELMQQSDHFKVVPVEYKNSGDTPFGDKKQVVGYWALAVQESGKEGFTFTPEDKKLLLEEARRSIEVYLKERKVRTEPPHRMTPGIGMHAGAFVTLKKKGELRGCIGRFTADIPLYQVIRQMAIASATQDNRFLPVAINELAGLEIEISVLSPMQKINSINEIIPGKHGIYIKKGNNTGTFLPQVATEQRWDLESFLGHCARDKAGIGWEGWKSADIWTYEACIFSEHEISGHKD